MVSYQGYVHVPVCKNAVEDDIVFNNFKQDSMFTTILEHTGVDNSHLFLAHAITKYPQYLNLIDWEIVRQNDSIGTASLEKYPELSNSVGLSNVMFSPSTIAYVFKALDILNHIKENNISNLRLLEIGGGYGGQAKMITDIAPLFDINIDSYTIIDLHWPTKLQEKYLNVLGYNNINFIAYEDLESGKVSFPNDFNYFISIYALSEFDDDVKQFYINNLSNAEKYYILWNIDKIEPMFLDADIEPEHPRTGPYNVLIKSRIL